MRCYCLALTCLHVCGARLLRYLVHVYSLHRESLHTLSAAAQREPAWSPQCGRRGAIWSKVSRCQPFQSLKGALPLITQATGLAGEPCCAICRSSRFPGAAACTVHLSVYLISSRHIADPPPQDMQFPFTACPNATIPSGRKAARQYQPPSHGTSALRGVSTYVMWVEVFHSVHVHAAARVLSSSDCFCGGHQGRRVGPQRCIQMYALPRSAAPSLQRPSCRTCIWLRMPPWWEHSACLLLSPEQLLSRATREFKSVCSQV